MLPCVWKGGEGREDPPLVRSEENPTSTSMGLFWKKKNGRVPVLEVKPPVLFFWFTFVCFEGTIEVLMKEGRSNAG